jgi:hypothetical protein
MFVSFVLDRAGIYDMGFDWDAGNWADVLAGYGIYTDVADYIPEPGDLVFFTPYSDGRFYVGIVTDVNSGFLDLFGETVNSVTVVYGDADNEVIQAVIDVGAIYGYGVLTPRAEEIEPEEPDPEEGLRELGEVDQIREIALRGMIKLCKNPEDDRYQALKKIFQFCDKAAENKDKENPQA